jgi:hypothetical protein
MSGLAGSLAVTCRCATSTPNEGDWWCEAKHDQENRDQQRNHQLNYDPHVRHRNRGCAATKVAVC